MRILALHSDYMHVFPEKKAVKDVDEKEEVHAEEVLVVLTTVEKSDESDPKGIVERYVQEVKDIFSQVRAKEILLYPYSHLSSDLAEPSFARKLLEDARKKLEEEGFKVKKAPFGWYKSFELKCKGHPLAELSRSISAVKKDETEALKREEKLKSYWYILTPEGELVDVEKFDFSGHENLKKFVDYEISGTRKVEEEPPHVKLMRAMELVDYEPGSDVGNLRWYPKGVMIKRLLEAEITNVVQRYGAMEVETPIMYDYKHPKLSRYLHRFPARQYILKSGENEFFLRFAACFGQYLIKHDMQISYRNLPLKLYELTHYSFRREQKGEVTGLRRLRTFTMPDMHTLVRDMGEAKEEFLKQYKLSMEWMKGLNLDYEVGIRFVRSFYEENEEFAKELVKLIGKPVLIEMWDERPFYFVMKFEFNVIDNLGKASALSTVQIDVENTERFEIMYTDKDNKRKHPLMLHASISGAIERNIYALLEKAAREKSEKKHPLLPLWLAPTQVRLCPVSDEYLEFAEELSEKLEKEQIRVDIDDRTESVGRKVRDAEVEWVPYILVIGKKEKESGKLMVRKRETDEKVEMKLKELVKEIKEKVKGYPFRPLPVPKLMTKRPVFYG